jgi:hypothetical protein
MFYFMLSKIPLVKHQHFEDPPTVSISLGGDLSSGTPRGRLQTMLLYAHTSLKALKFVLMEQVATPVS